METSFFYSALALFILTNISLTSSKSLSNLTTDEQSLIAFKNSISNPNTNSILLKNWSIHTPICEWIGVYCGTKHHRVTSLNISGLGLRGTLSPHLGNLTFLRFLDIRSNNLSGVLPSELSKLRRLEYINVGSNNFRGEIPSWLGALPKLRDVYLYNNTFSGRIPSSIFNISLQTLNIYNNQISGSVPETIFNVSSLTVIDLGINRLSGKLPNNMCSNTPKLTLFSVYLNQLSGEIPRNIIKCRELENLQLHGNHFSGEIPGGIGNFSMLKALYLWRNEFEGSIPKQMWNLTSLEVIVLQDNKFTGELAEEIWNLAILRDLIIGNNSFSGEIPPAVFNISTLVKLDLSFNEFSGTLPTYTGLSLPDLQLLFLQNNTLSGPIPSSINNASQLLKLDLAANSFTGSIPSFPNLRQLFVFAFNTNHLSGARSPALELEFLSPLANSQNLQYIEVSENPLNGVLPTSIGNLSQSFQFFSAYAAGIRGAIPSEIGNLTNLLDINLHDNQLSGSIPSTIGNMKKLGRLYLFDNQLRGSIPIDLCEMSSLGELHLSNNELEGPIPDCVDEIQSLRKIELAFNNLNSSIPPNFWNLVDLVYLNLSSNYLSGRISSQIGKLKLISEIFLDSNQLLGDIPGSIDGCESLVYLDLSNNKFGGSIPQSLGNMRGLSELDLSNNTLSGMIPESLQQLQLLDYFNVSFNRLEGEIPNGGAFANFTARSFVNNSALCGAARFEEPPCLDVDGGSRSKNVGRLMKYILPPLFSTIFIVIIVVLLVRRCRRVIVPIAEIDSSLGVSWRVTSYVEILQATNSFSEMNVLGRGSFGSVYKGILFEGLGIAVKVFNLELEGANKSFETESRILSTIRHRNLVRIVGCCTNMEFKALILEFMPNGSLDSWLYSSNNDSTDILQLLNIAIDVALALEYLHHGNTFPVVHCDMKPSNVLLDGDMTARVADFGISKLFEEGEAMIQTKTLATIGYAAPEYGSEGKVSTSADVYSFGMLLLEIFTRKKPTDDMFGGEMSLKEWVSEALEASAMNQVLAPALLSEEDRHFVSKEECVASVFDLAMKCLAVSAEERMSMIEATRTLKKIKAKVVTTTVTTRRQQHAVTTIIT